MSKIIQKYSDTKDDASETSEDGKDIDDVEEVDELEEQDDMEEVETAENEDIGNDEKDSDDEGGDSCLYNIKRAKKVPILDSDDFFEDEKIVMTKKIVPPNERITKPILYKYERVRILSERRQQLVNGAKPMVKVNDNLSDKEIAQMELQSKVIPFIIVRTLPNNTIEHWKLSELEIIN